ncbi:MAG: MFS transporter [Lachnospiraceae bacterium]|nr:MFS transporter [Lachnospiraceae bacterium]
MEEKRYLKWYNKVGYGSGDIAGNVVYAFLTSFVMIYLTDTVGLNSGIVGTLIAVSKLFDGISDVFFGSMIDRTKSKMGKARPWMFYGFFGCAVTLFGVFAIPTTMGKTAQYAWFFIAYTLLNAVFYTANNIAYAALTSLVTKNSKERVEMGSFRFMFSFGTNLLIQSITFGAVEALGGGAAGWRAIAIIYCIVGIITNTLSCFSVKELSEEELRDGEINEEDSKLTLGQTFKLLVSNKYFLMIVVIYILQQLRAAMVSVGTYFMTYVLLNQKLFGVFSWAINIPLIIALAITPTLVAKMKGMYKVNKLSYMFATACRLGLVVAGYLGSVPLMLLFTVLTSLGEGPWQGDVGAVIASCSEHTYLKDGKRIDGSMFSCTSFGTKLGGGIGVALSGWLLDMSGYINNAPVQPDSCISMMNIMYLWLPFAFDLIITIILSFLNVEEANAKLEKHQKAEERLSQYMD